MWWSLVLQVMCLCMIYREGGGGLKSVHMCGPMVGCDADC